MTSLKFKSIMKIDMFDLPILAGQLIYCTDTKESYYDDTDEIRMQVGCLVLLTAEQDRLEHTTPSPTLLYYVEESRLFYRYNTDWYTVSSEEDIRDVLGTYEELVPKTLKNDDGTLIAPRTLASVTYMSSGETVEDKLKTITRVGTCINRVICTTQGQMSFEIPFPFENYLEQGNTFEISIGSVWVDDIRYKVENTTLTFIDSSDGVDLGRVISFKFIFNSAAPYTGTVSTMDGKYIAKKSIPTSRLEKVSDSSSLDDSTTLASSKALKLLKDDLLDSINTIADTTVARFTSSGTKVNLVGVISNFTLIDGAILYMRLHTDIGSNPLLSINGSPYYPIYSGDYPLESGYLSNEMVKLSFNKLESRFYVNSGEDYKISSDNCVYYCNGGETAVVIDIASYDAKLDKVKVYQNNLRIFENINYIITNKTVSLLNYSAEAGDMFYIEIDRIRKVRL